MVTNNLLKRLPGQRTPLLLLVLGVALLVGALVLYARGDSGEPTLVSDQPPPPSAGLAVVADEATTPPALGVVDSAADSGDTPPAQPQPMDTPSPAPPSPELPPVQVQTPPDADVYGAEPPECVGVGEAISDDYSTRLIGDIATSAAAVRSARVVGYGRFVVSMLGDVDDTGRERFATAITVGGISEGHVLIQVPGSERLIGVDLRRTADGDMFIRADSLELLADTSSLVSVPSSPLGDDGAESWVSLRSLAGSGALPGPQSGWELPDEDELMVYADLVEMASWLVDNGSELDARIVLDERTGLASMCFGVSLGDLAESPLSDSSLFADLQIVALLGGVEAPAEVWELLSATVILTLADNGDVYALEMRTDMAPLLVHLARSLQPDDAEDEQIATMETMIGQIAAHFEMQFVVDAINDPELVLAG